MRDRDEALRGWIWKRPQNDAVEHREYRRGCSDPERERRERDKREGRRPPQRSNTLANLSANDVRDIHTTPLVVGDEIDVSCLAAIRRVVAEHASRFHFGVVSRPAGGDELLDPSLDVKAKLFVHFASDTIGRAGQSKYSPKSGPSRFAPNH